MDNYTKMCARLKELQGSCPIDFKGYTPLFNGIVYDRDYKFYYQKAIQSPKKIWEKTIIKSTWLPSLAQLIGMLEDRDCYWELWVSYSDKKKDRRYKGLLADKNRDGKLGSGGNTPQEALLKLVAYELWGKTWDEYKEVWEEG